MESFRWDPRFETGLDKVDEQHRHLVGVLNRYGAAVMQSEQGSQAQAEQVFDELTRYAAYHFETERSLVEAAKLDHRHARAHRDDHARFLSELARLRSSAAESGVQGWQRLLEFLSHWLIFHILGTDQVMAQQILAVQAGRSPSEAYDPSPRMTDGAAETLLNSLNALFKIVSDQNRELLELNQTLEARVRERTHALATAVETMEVMAMTDALTGLPNRRQAMKRLEMEWAILDPAAAPLAVMLIDTDNFKHINDTCGHDQGDAVLRELSTVLRHMVRTDDLVCRLGGDEFLVICPKTPLEGALHVAELMRQRVSELRVNAGAAEWLGSISVGVAVREPDMSSHEALVKLADQGVYMAKGRGRNCVMSPQRRPSGEFRAAG